LFKKLPIVTRGGGGKEIFIVVSGRVLLHSSSVRGREFIIELLKTGDLFGLAALFGGDQRVDAIALTQSAIVGLDVRTAERAIRQDQDFAFALTKYLVQHLLRRTEQAEDFALLSFGGRLAKLLLDVAGGQLTRIAKGSKFKCDYSQTLMARMIGGSRETVSRQMQKWEENGLLSHSGKTICLLDPAQLRKIADGLSG
jgi:CRP-like cAMP-binding protein